MREELLDRIVREVRERKNESRAAVEESRLLEAALAALDQSIGVGGAAAAARGVGRRRGAGSTGSRAPRGENLRRIRAAVEQRSGATAGEVAAATGIARATVASTLGKLARDGELEKQTRPGGGVGYRHARPPAEQGAETPPGALGENVTAADASAED